MFVRELLGDDAKRLKMASVAKQTAGRFHSVHITQKLFALYRTIKEQHKNTIRGKCDQQIKKRIN